MEDIDFEIHQLKLDNSQLYRTRTTDIKPEANLKEKGCDTRGWEHETISTVFSVKIPCTSHVIVQVPEKKREVPIYGILFTVITFSQ